LDRIEHLEVTLVFEGSVGLVPVKTGWSCMFLIKHRFCSGPLDGKVVIQAIA
jgi:hypothetical protein